jgi:hypothetical protein
MKKISELESVDYLENDDEFPIVDKSSQSTKKTSVGQIKDAISSEIAEMYEVKNTVYAYFWTSSVLQSDLLISSTAYVDIPAPVEIDTTGGIIDVSVLFKMRYPDTAQTSDPFLSIKYFRVDTNQNYGQDEIFVGSLHQNGGFFCGVGVTSSPLPAGRYRFTLTLRSSVVGTTVQFSRHCRIIIKEMRS